MLFFLKKIFSSNTQPIEDITHSQGKRYYKDMHSIEPFMIDTDAKKIIFRIQNFGYKAYLVGGSVRDLLVNKKPKDFDIVTNATPQELRKIFSNSRIIGKRFKIVHVFFNQGNKVFEISTARSLPHSRFSSSKKVDYIKKDNQYGSFQEDVMRRDITINALLLDIKTNIIIDYTGGFEDLKENAIKTIGDPDYIFPEDPVRILRIIKVRNQLNANLQLNLIKSIQKYAHNISKVSKDRLHEEINKFFYTGISFYIFRDFLDLAILDTLMPNIFTEASKKDSFWKKQSFHDTLLGKVLHITDNMIQEYHQVNINVYYALLILYLFDDPLNTTKNERIQVLSKVNKELALTKKFQRILEEIYSFLPLFLKEEKEVSPEEITKTKNPLSCIEAFLVFKIYSRAKNLEDNIQKALFWEIYLPNKLKNSIKKKRNLPIPRPLVV